MKILYRKIFIDIINVKYMRKMREIYMRAKKTKVRAVYAVLFISIISIIATCISMVKADDENETFTGIVTITHNLDDKVNVQILDPVHVFNIPYSENYKLSISSTDYSYDGIDHYEKVDDNEFIIYAKITPLRECKNTVLRYTLDISENENDINAYTDISIHGASERADYVYITGNNEILGGSEQQYNAYYVDGPGANPVDITSNVYWYATEDIGTIDQTGKLTASNPKVYESGYVACRYSTEDSRELINGFTIHVENEMSEERSVLLGISSHDIAALDYHHLGYEYQNLYLYNIPVTEATNIRITSSDESVAKVRLEDEIGYDTNMRELSLFGLSVGTTTITVEVEYDGQIYTDSTEIKISADQSEYLHVFIEGEDNIDVGQETQLNAQIYYGGDSQFYKNNQFTWKSSDESIATVSEEGVVMGVKKGSVTITASVPYSPTSSKMIVGSHEMLIGISSDDDDPEEPDKPDKPDDPKPQNPTPDEPTPTPDTPEENPEPSEPSKDIPEKGDTNNKSDSSNGEENNGSNAKSDFSKANKVIPQTGETKLKIFAIIVLAAIAIISLRKIVKSNKY